MSHAIPFTTSLPLVVLTTDGSCKPNPGRGAWAYILKYGNAYKEGSGRAENTTNNRMEITAVIEGLRAIKRPCRVIVRTDSKITIAWTKRGAKWGAKKIKNMPEAHELVLEYHRVAKPHIVTFDWVRGHAGDPDNERCDQLAENMLT